MADINVLMLGGPGCGKTTVLSSCFNQMINERVNNLFPICDKTIVGPANCHFQHTLNNIRCQLEKYLSRRGNNVFMVDSRGLPYICNYIFQIRLPETFKTMEVQFREVPGNFLGGIVYHNNLMLNDIRESDVFIIVIDTPYLMDGEEIVAKMVNSIYSIHNILMQIDNDNGRKNKQIIFVPVKCEKWAKKGKIDDVVRAVEKYYGEIIRDMKALNKTEISIIPIQTVGDLLFSDLRDPYILFNPNTQKSIKCSKISDCLVTLCNGQNHKIVEDEVLYEDQEAFIMPIGITRPYAWYYLPTDHKAEYSPYNCEQLLLHIIRFMFKKKIEEVSNGFLKLIGAIPISEMKRTLDILSSENLLKDNEDGIKILKKCF